MSVNSNDWVNTLSNTERAAWDQYAQETPLPDKFGEPINIGGRQHFLRTNNARVFAGVTPIGFAPSTPGVAEAPTFSLTGDTTDGIEFGLLSPTLAAGDLVSVGIGNIVNQSVNFYASPYRFAAGIVSVTPQPVTLVDAVDVVIGQKYFIEVRLLLADGKVSFAVRDSVDILV